MSGTDMARHARGELLFMLDADNDVLLRTQGEYGDDPNVYTAIFDALSKGEAPTDPRG